MAMVTVTIQGKDFGFAPANRHTVTIEHKIGRADIGQAAGFVDDGQAIVDRFEQPFERGAIAVLGRLPAACQNSDFVEITGNVHERPNPLPTPSALIPPANQGVGTD